MLSVSSLSLNSFSNGSSEDLGCGLEPPVITLTLEIVMWTVRIGILDLAVGLCPDNPSIIENILDAFTILTFRTSSSA